MEGFERNKNLWVGTMIGVVVFFVALMFRGVFMSGDEVVLQKTITRWNGMLANTNVPPPGATADLREKLEQTEAAFKKEAGVVAQTVTGNALAVASIRRILADIGRADEASFAPYRELLSEAPNACYSRLYDEARRHFQRKSTERDVLFATELGLDGLRFEIDEVHRALHALSVAVHAVNAAIDAGVVSIEDVSATFVAAARNDDSNIEADHVSIKVIGAPDAHATLVNQMNDSSRFVAFQDASFGGDRQGSGSFRDEQNVPMTITLKALRVVPQSDDAEAN